MRRTQFIRALPKMTLATLWAGALSACAIVDNAGLHTETLNESIADYNAYATLLNIVRASESEPLNFVAVSQGSPNTSFSGTATLPTFTFSPPHHLASYTTPGNSLSATTSDALTVQPIDDPASWQALLTPIDVGTIGFFIKQGYAPELLFWLFIDRIRVCNDSQCQNSVELVNDPDDPSFGLLRGDVPPGSPTFLGIVPQLIFDGLTVEIERGPPKGGSTPSSKICFKASAAHNAKVAFNRRLPPPSSATAKDCRAEPPQRDDCVPKKEDDWLKGQQASSGQQSASQSDSSSKGAASIPQPIYVYLNYPDPTKVPKAKQPEKRTLAWYDLPPVRENTRCEVWGHKQHSKGACEVCKQPPKGAKLQFSTRSAYAVYLYLGRVLKGNNGEPITLNVEYTSDTSDDTAILHIVHNRTSNCFVQLAYNSEQYCVPKDAYNTKRTFAILHQLVGLNIAYTSTPATLNVRTLP